MKENTQKRRKGGEENMKWGEGGILCVREEHDCTVQQNPDD